MIRLIHGLSLLLFACTTLSAQTREGQPDVVRVPKRTITVDGKLEDWGTAVFRTIMAGGTHAVGDVSVAYDDERLFLAYRVRDESPLLNRGQDALAHFHEGDAVELFLGGWRAPGGAVQSGDQRLLFVPLNGVAKAVLYRQIDPSAPPDMRHVFTSPVRSVTMARVEELTTARVAFRKTGNGYICEVSVPWRDMGLTPRSGLKVLGDLGVLESNDGGIVTQARSCLFDRLATCVNDIPTEVELTPGRWGAFIFD